MTNPEPIARIIERLARVGRGLHAITTGGTAPNLSVPRAVMDHHRSAVDGVLADLRGLGGQAPTRAVSSRDHYATLLRAWDDARGGWLCATCRVLVTDRTDAHVDHIVPLARGGSNDRENLRVLCARCNLQKGAAA